MNSYRTGGDFERRDALKALALGALAFDVGGVTVLLTPRQARAEAVPPKVLSPEEVAIVERLGETIVPGAAEAGLAHYLDQQLAIQPADSLLVLRYLNVPPPYLDFYRPGLASVERLARSRYGGPLASLDEAAVSEIVSTIRDGNPKDWQGGPAPLFYFVFRADAVDVVYGTVEGFDTLDVPYLPHIEPIEKW